MFRTRYCAFKYIMTREEFQIHCQLGTHSVGVLKSTDVTKASAILGISWDLAWNIMNKAVERGFGTKTSNPEITGLDDKSFGKPL